MTIKKRLGIAFAVVFFVSIASVGTYSFISQKSRIEQSFSDLASNESRLFQATLAMDADGLARAHAGFARSEGLMQLFAAKKRDELLAAAKPVFEEIRAANNITHMYFINPDGTVLLRVHKPEQAGDKLTRATYLQAAESGKTASGMEMGKNFFSLRSVRPVTFRGTLIGYFELAQEIDHVFREMKQITGNDVSVFLTDSFLQEKKAEVAGEKVGTFTLLDSTDKGMTLRLAAASGLLQRALEKPAVAVVDLEGRKFVVGASAVVDAAGAKAGILLSQKEVTSLLAGAWRAAAGSSLIFAAILLGASLLLLLSLRGSLSLFGQLRSHIEEVTRTLDLRSRLQVSTDDEIGQLGSCFNRMMERIAEMVGKVNRSAEELTRVSDKLSDASRQVIDAANLQAQGVRTTSRGVEEINGSLAHISEGVENLSLAASQTSASILEMSASIEEVALNAETTSLSVTEVSSSIHQMGTSVKQVAEGATSLMEASATTASAIMEMDSSINQVGQNAQETAKISEEVRTVAEQGRQAVTATISGIDRIRESTRITCDAVEVLNRKASDIGAIISVIEEVAGQTNLLALNAAILAAQAGEHGKGFAVVAGEIKELAEKTSSSTREISTVIFAVQEETRRAVEAMAQAEKSVAEGESLSQVSGKSLEEIVASVHGVSRRVEQIARATVEQARGSQQIRQAMSQVSDMVEQIAKATLEQGQGGELIAAAVERIKDLAAQVMSSTAEQNSAGRFIAGSTESITGMIAQIRNACAEQNAGTVQVMEALRNIEQSAELNLGAAKVLEDSSGRLTRQIDLLREEVKTFSV